MKILITGSSGLIGGEAVEHFDRQGHTIIGVDNNMRKDFFGPQGDTEWNLHRIFHNSRNFTHCNNDIRIYSEMENYVFKEHAPFDVVIHCAAQPSHDKAKDIPVLDFEVNALGTVNLLELTRQYCPDATFIFMSTNKVYGDVPNELRMVERETRYDYLDLGDINESMRIDRCTHSVFGSSKVAADVMVQEYGKYFNMNTCVFRGGCLTGPNHSGVELHGFLSYLVKCVVNDKPYTIYGYKGKQVRDNIHSHDVIMAMEEVIKKPVQGEVFNMGGGRENSISMLEAIMLIEKYAGKKLNYSYVDENRIGDHICYISDLSKFKGFYPNWKITKSIDDIVMELISSNIKGPSERYIAGDGYDNYFESYASQLIDKCYGDVLDIGCGHGYLTNRIAYSSAVTSIIGTDLYDGYKVGDKAVYMTMDTKDLMMAPREFDTVISTEHIEHLDEDTQMRLLLWISNNIKGGTFLGSMPYPDDVDNKNVYHLRTYTMDEWKSMLEKVFKNVNVWDVGKCYCWQASGPIPQYIA